MYEYCTKIQLFFPKHPKDQARAPEKLTGPDAAAARNNEQVAATDGAHFFTVNINTLRKKAKAQTLEVEDILAAAARRPAGLQAELQRLSAELEWSHTPYPRGGGHVVPFARWAEMAGAYAEHGIPGLAGWMQAKAQATAGNGAPAEYVLAMLEALKTQEANDALFSLFAHVLDDPGGHLAEALELASTINLTFSFKGRLPPTLAQADRARSLLMALYPLARKEAERCTVVCALRGVGDESTAQFLATIKPFGGPHAGLEKSALRAIRKRLQGTTSATP